jgi:DNA invertase Pin-like site-specific DNA recombinase
MALIGYARISTRHQDLTTQIKQLEAAGCERIFAEQFTGSRMKRPEFDRCLAFLRRGDVLTVTRLKRLGRNTRGLLELVDLELAPRGVELNSLAESFDTRTPTGRMLFTVLSAVAEMDRELTVEASEEALAIARAEGKTGGRRPVLTPEQVEHARRLFAEGESRRAIARTLGVGRSTIGRVVA